MLLQVNHLQKIFQTRFSKEKTTALQDVAFGVDKGEYIAIMGESGSGKTTLLNILATLEKPTSGSVILNDQDITKIKENQLAVYRREHLGFIFQDFNLLDTLSVRDNIFLPLVLGRQKTAIMEQRLAQLAPKLNIADLLNKQPFELSGGQKQRVAIARALITQPELVLADEPTAALDFKNSEALLSLLESINQAGQTILMVTHSAMAAAHAKRVLFIKDGRIFHQLYRADREVPAFMQEISLTMTNILGTEVQ
ncbi:ABC transporter ATP-binding protein [Oenococcus kitaharae]|uniref:ABC transporter ATP-binding protein n=1 Tax=Oenococcus kitaharae DSM 17330 TaxID=1045004 RepID=G9WGH2_9LACO|nr:ABC transporter ATP-binding protein [Oenococcus kitaharae]EHN59800.1 ABC transporter ATP-binding protein [Oenococcus kitaharae DSM 17330]OEY83618.1 bacteriocin ABC transporter ATP-binding protein [Oenococcus kitaharae]OEY85416.1 bacteriocin ABC transporter ATP-binding protein [Oenococcus kitaharae]OEY86269.1 bacteriocin ABC transporter ATP-binding protein [Oenococcus kitaharae]